MVEVAPVMVEARLGVATSQCSESIYLKRQ